MAFPSLRLALINRASQADFLDDKLQTLPDLESLDALLVSVRNQHVLLRKQVISTAATPVAVALLLTIYW